MITEPPEHRHGRHLRCKTPMGWVGAIFMALTFFATGENVARADTVKQGLSAVVVMYHRFGEDAYPSTNVRLEQLDAHIKELSREKYRVLPLEEIVAALHSGRPLPDRAIGITVDDAFLSVYREAWPRFREAGLPFTVFVATDSVDRGVRGYMNWDQIREMRDAGVSIGHHTASHLHMAAASIDTNRQEILSASDRFRKMTGTTPALFAYPYGENSLAVQNLVKQSGFAAAFGQHSGAIGGGQDLFYLPRFALNESYGSLERLTLIANALPLPVSDVTPVEHLVTAPNPPLLGFTVAADVSRLGRLSCFTSQEGRVRQEFLGRRVEIRPKTPFPPGRTRVNCTLPTADGRWHWYGRQFYRVK